MVECSIIIILKKKKKKIAGLVDLFTYHENIYLVDELLPSLIPQSRSSKYDLNNPVRENTCWCHVI